MGKHVRRWFWFCHECGDGPYDLELYTHCFNPSCYTAHARCAYCKVEEHKGHGIFNFIDTHFGGCTKNPFWVFYFEFHVFYIFDSNLIYPSRSCQPPDFSVITAAVIRVKYHQGSRSYYQVPKVVILGPFFLVSRYNAAQA
ncbi:hypothetical protein B0T19DRAFT_397104 [Cercophora scortea]|uniref:Uncharacterized protein n=1 Tax=Cercophora scortea TaxID=314031 RepID=A0AAE0MLY2_9PEZI|nr:hypothetical protein B0T19DRAFT_397104 [Cercophora scortea]